MPTYTGIQWSSVDGEEPNLFTVVSDNCGSLEPGASCVIEVAFNPTLPGKKTGILTVADVKPSPSGASASAYLEGFGAGQVVSVKPGAIDFGPRAEGAGPSQFQVVDVVNEGQVEMKMGAVSVAREFHFDDDQFAVQPGGTCIPGLIVPPSGFCTVRVAFSPTASGRFSADLRIQDNAPSSPQYAVLEGTGISSHADPGKLQATIVRHPAKLTRRRSAVFSFRGSAETAGFECRVDSGSFAACSSPIKFARLKPGRHRFAVRGVNAAGQLGAQPARFGWRIERPPNRAAKP